MPGRVTPRQHLSISLNIELGGEGGIRTHGGHKDHNGFRDRPIQPLWHLSSVDKHAQLPSGAANYNARRCAEFGHGLADIARVPEAGRSAHIAGEPPATPRNASVSVSA